MFSPNHKILFYIKFKKWIKNSSDLSNYYFNLSALPRKIFIARSGRTPQYLEK